MIRGWAFLRDRLTRDRIVPILLIAVLWTLGFPSLGKYNVTWDEALGDLFFGERYFSYFTSFDPAYLDFRGEPYPEGHTPDLGVSPFRIRPWEYYPFANTLGAASAELLSRRLGWMDYFDGFHAVNLFFAALLIWVLYRFLARRAGVLAATAAVVLLFTSPRVVCHLMANTKDFPLMALYAVLSIVFLRAFEAGSTRGILAAGVLLGATLATKANALFFPAVPGLVLLLGGVPKPWEGRLGRLLGALFGAGAVGAATMVALWPYLWADPIGRYREHLLYIGLRKGYTRLESIAPAFEAIGLTTPPVFLVLALLGLGLCARRAWRSRRAGQTDRLALLVVVWVLVVLGRFLLPQAVNFDGVRHFLELFPALAIAAGLATARLAELVRDARLRVALAAALLLPGAWAVVRSHPFEIAYWNVLAGGPAGAYARDLPQAGDYWGMSYRLGLEWINANAPPDSALAVPVVEHAVRLVAETRLRRDVILLPVTRPYTPVIAPDRLEKTRALARERPVYVMFVVREDWMNELMTDCLRRLTPEVAWELDGAPILLIYRYVWPETGSPG